MGKHLDGLIYAAAVLVGGCAALIDKMFAFGYVGPAIIIAGLAVVVLAYIDMNVTRIWPQH